MQSLILQNEDIYSAIIYKQGPAIFCMADDQLYFRYIFKIRILAKTAHVEAPFFIIYISWPPI